MNYKKILILVFIILINGLCYGQKYFFTFKVENEKILNQKESKLIDFFDREYNGVIENNDINAIFKTVPKSKKSVLKNLYEVHITKEGNIDQLIQIFNKLDGISNIQKRRYYKAIACDDSYPPVNDTWIVNEWCNNDALELMEANCAWDITTGSSSVHVAIADTDFEESHEDLINQFTEIKGPVTEQHAHGTMVAGMVAAETNNNKGIASIGYNIKITGYRVYHFVDTAQDGSINVYGSPYSAIMQAYDDGKRIINVSWSGTGLTNDEAKTITENGTVLVVSAGNTPNATNHSNIANIPGVVNVSGVDANNEHEPTGHAHNEWVDICALSTNVSTTKDPDWGSGSLYGGAWGTSFAAPQVCGVIGLMLSINSSLVSSHIESILKKTTNPISDADLYPGMLGSGRINAYCAVYQSQPLNLSGALSGDYERYFINIDNATINTPTTINSAEVAIEGPFEVNAEFTISNPENYNCP